MNLCQPRGPLGRSQIKASSTALANIPTSYAGEISRWRSGVAVEVPVLHNPKNSIQSGTEGVEIKTTRKPGGAVDTRGARKQWMCVFVNEVDGTTEPANARSPLVFTEIYLGEVVVADFRKNARGELGTRTATLDAKGIARLRENWVYRLR